MKEPRLESVLLDLNEMGKNFDDKKNMTNDAIEYLFQNEDNKLQQLLYYCKEEQAATVENAISSCTGDERKRIQSALIAMYPITKNVVLQMLRRASIGPKDCLEIIDFEGELVEAIKNLLEKITGSSSARNSYITEYSENLSKLDREINELQGQRQKIIDTIDDYEKKEKEKNELEREIKILEENKDIEKEIEKLKQKKNELEAKKQRDEEEKNKLCGEIEKLTESLEDSPKDSSGTSDKEYQEALQALRACVSKLKGR